MKLLKVLDPIAQVHNRPVSQVVINWNAQKPYIGTELVGCRTPEKAIQNCAAFDWMLSDAEISTIDRAIERLAI